MIVIFWVLLAIAVGIFAGRYNRSAIGWLLISLLVSPLIGWIFVLALGRKEPTVTITQAPHNTVGIAPKKPIKMGPIFAGAIAGLLILGGISFLLDYQSTPADNVLAVAPDKDLGNWQTITTGSISTHTHKAAIDPLAVSLIESCKGWEKTCARWGAGGIARLNIHMTQAAKQFSEDPRCDRVSLVFHSESQSSPTGAVVIIGDCANGERLTIKY